MKRKLGSVQYMYPVPIVLIGTANDQGDVDFTEVGDCSVGGIKSPLITISLNDSYLSTKNILKTGGFSLNIPNTEMLSKTDFCGIYSGTTVDKSDLFEYILSDKKRVPIIESCPLNMECEVIKEFLIEKRHFFVGKVVETYINEEYVDEENGKIKISDLTVLDPIIYALDNNYYSIGRVIGKGYAEGKLLKKD